MYKRWNCLGKIVSQFFLVKKIRNLWKLRVLWTGALHQIKMFKHIYLAFWKKIYEASYLYYTMQQFCNYLSLKGVSLKNSSPKIVNGFWTRRFFPRRLSFAQPSIHEPSQILGGWFFSPLFQGTKYISLNPQDGGQSSSLT